MGHFNTQKADILLFYYFIHSFLRFFGDMLATVTAQDPFTPGGFADMT